MHIAPYRLSLDEAVILATAGILVNIVTTLI